MIKIKKVKFNIIFIIILFFSILLVNTVYAEDINTTQNYSNERFDIIQNLIDDAKSGDSIYLINKTYTGDGSAISINKNISIYGSDSVDTILDANSKSNIFIISKDATVNIFGLTFINGKTTSKGGAITNNGNLTVFNSNFINNIAYNSYTGRISGDGGAINNDGTLTVCNSNFNSNYAYNGGAIRGSKNTQISTFNCSFNDNEATFGGAIDAYFSDSKIINTTFIHNSCHEGGAIYNRFSDFLLLNSIFVNNSAARGGGIYNNRGYLVIRNSEFYSNAVSHLGGGVKSWGVCEIYDSIIKDNSAELGGGIYISEYLMTVDNCIIENNEAVEGGGVIADSDGHLNIKNSRINNNYAEIGGGIDCSWGYLNLDNCILNNNRATDKGGGLACVLFESNVTNAILSNNTAKYGGGLYVGDIHVNFLNLTIVNNSATEGGGVYNIGNSIFNDFKINNNFASVGGGIYNNKRNLTLINCEINSNNASNGGAVFNNAYLNVVTSDIILNSASNGGAVFNNAQLRLINSIANNNFAKYYGGFALNNGNLSLLNSNFNSNEAALAGVVYNAKKVTLINNSSFSNNKADKGAVIFNYAYLIIDNSDFLKNTVLHTYGVIGVVQGNVSISNVLFELNEGSDEGGVIFNSNGSILIDSSQFISNNAISYGGAIDNAGKLIIINTLFDKNHAYGAGAIDNGGDVTIIKSNFTNNRATKNGGAIDNNYILNVVGSIFENNVAGAQGGAIIARKDINLSYSSLYANQASQGDAIYSNNLNCNLINNWWGSNNPQFESLFNFKISDDFTWIIMSFKSTSGLMQYENANLVVSLNQIKNNLGEISDFNSIDLLPIFEVRLSTGNTLLVKNSYISKTIPVLKISYLTAKLHNQSIKLTVSINPSKIIGNNVVADYSNKVMFKVRIIGKNGKVVGKDEIVKMVVLGKTYTVKTDKNGYAIKAFNLIPGKYAISTSYKGALVKNLITVKHVLKAVSKFVKKTKIIKYNAGLKTSNGKVIIGKKITFIIKGKVYSALTNKKGIATVGFKNLKVGKYWVAVRYLKSQIKSLLVVKK